MLTILANRIISIFIAVFAQNIFADGSVSFIELPKQPLKSYQHIDTAGLARIRKPHEPKPYQWIESDTNKAGLVRTNIFTSDGNFNSTSITMIHDSVGDLKHYIYRENKEGLIVQEVDNGVLRNIVSGRSRCHFFIIEPSGDTTDYRLNPERIPKGAFSEKEEKYDFFNMKVPPDSIPLKTKNEWIIFNRWDRDCKYMHGFWN